MNKLRRFFRYTAELVIISLALIFLVNWAEKIFPPKLPYAELVRECNYQFFTQCIDRCENKDYSAMPDWMKRDILFQCSIWCDAISQATPIPEGK